MSISSSLAGRLSIGGRKGGKQRRYAGSKASGVGEALARRLGGPGVSESNVSVGVKARLGLVTKRNKSRLIPYSPYPQPHQHNEHPPTSPVLVKIPSGKMVGGMRSDHINKVSPRPPPPLVSLDRDRGLTVSLENKNRRSPEHRRREKYYHDEVSPDRGIRYDDRAERRYRNSRMYRDPDSPEVGVRHGDSRRYRASPRASSSRHAARVHSDFEDSDEDVGFEFRGRKHYDGEVMDLDPSNVGDVYSASLQYTRNTTHHHHHHHHPPSPPPTEPRFSGSMALYRPPRRRSPALPPRRRPASPPPKSYVHKYASPPPSPPNFHPKSNSPSPRKIKSSKQSALSAEKARRLLATERIMKSSRVAKNAKVVKPVKEVKRLGKSGKSAKGSKYVTRESSPESVSSNSDDSSSSSSSSSEEQPVVYRAPVHRVLPEPHRQQLDPAVAESIAQLQGKQPGYRSGPGPGVRHLIYIPTKTSRTLNQRFTLNEAR